MTGLPTVGGDKDAWGQKLTDYLNAGHSSDGTHPLDSRYPQYGPLSAGAKFDGTTDDSAALNNVQSADGQVVALPPATAVVNAASVSFRRSGERIQGAGMNSTVLKGTSGSLLSILSQLSSGYASNVEISDMTLDGSGMGSTASAVRAYGWGIGRLTLRRVKFINFPGSIIDAGYASEFVIEDCEADGAGLAQATFFSATNKEFEVLHIRRNKLRWLHDGILLGSGSPASTQYHSAYVDISDNYIDLGWWLIKSASTNSGGTVSYTSTTLTDTAASFGTITASTNVRVLKSLQTGTITGGNGTQVVDSAASFVSNNVWRGHILRSGTSFGVVSLVESATQLHVEEWLDQTTYQPVAPPASSSSYTVYGVIIGTVASNTSTSVTVSHGAGGGGGGWYDLHGTEVTPASGTRYELLIGRPNYPVFLNYPAEKVVISRNLVRRGWSDNLELFGSRLIVTDNVVEDGQDEGIVLQGYSTTNPGVKNLVQGNLARHNGASGLLVLNQADCEIGINQYEDNAWGRNSSNDFGQLQVNSSVRTTVIGGRASLSGESTTNPVGLRVEGSATASVKVIGFSDDGNSSNGSIWVRSTVPAGSVDLLDVPAPVYEGTTNGQRLRVKGTGAPSIPASPGSQFFRTDGGASTTLYVKETANDNTGWAAYGAPAAAVLAYGHRVAYSTITAGVTVAGATSLTTMAAFTGAPSITLPNDGHTYRVTLSASSIAPASQQICAIGVGTATNAILKYTEAGFSGELNAPCYVETDVVASGQTINCYAYASSGGNVTLAAGSNAPAELSAVLVAA